MICSKCKQSRDMNEITFKPAGMVPGIAMKRYEAICRDCVKAIDITSKEYPF